MSNCKTTYWKGYGLSKYNRDNGTNHNEVTMVDDCGTLIMKRDGNTFIKGPSLVQKASNLLSTVKDVVSQAAEGGAVFAPEHVVEHRLNLCKSCPYFKDNICRACGCMTNAKTRLAAARCPEGKWPSV